MSRELLDEARAAGIALHRDGDQVRVRVHGDPDADLIDELLVFAQLVLDALRQEDDERQYTIEAAVSRLFEDRPEYRERRIGQIACQLYVGGYLDDPALDSEVRAILGERVLVSMSG